MANEATKVEERKPKRYRARQDVWVSHLCRLFREGEEFSAVFPENMRLGKTLVEIPEPVKGKADEGKSLAG